MKILVANLGSTSFKYSLYAMEGENLLAKGGYERIGKGGEHADHASAIRHCLSQITGQGKPLAVLEDLSAVGFKAVHAAGMSGCRFVDDSVLSAMDAYADLLPAHNPAYIAAMRAFSVLCPALPQVALFETAFFEKLDPAVTTYAVPKEWREQDGFRRYGFHGASHRWASEQVRSLQGPGKKHVSCHLGGSSSLAAIVDGTAVNTSFGMTPQSGLSQSYRCGDMDSYALLHVMRKRGLNPAEAMRLLGAESGLAAIGGVGGDLRDLEKAANEGNTLAQLALDVFVYDIRRYLGAFIIQMGGVDVISFSGGIGENAAFLRIAVLRDLSKLGIAIDSEKNASARDRDNIASPHSKTAVYVIKTNEEIIVARAAAEMMGKRKGTPPKSPEGGL